MLTHHPFNSLGGANHGWLNAKHHFSFANYYDPKKMSHGELLVINDDRIAPYTGFDTHPPGYGNHHLRAPWRHQSRRQPGKLWSDDRR